MRLSIVLIHYHTPQLLQIAVDALVADIAASKLEAELLIIDNGSKDEDRVLLENLPARLVYAETNLGYSGAINVAAAETRSEVLLVMNPDVVVLPGCLKSLVQVLESGVSAVGPQFYWNRDKSLILPPPEKRNRREEIIRRLAMGREEWLRIARNRWRRQARKYWLADRPFISYELSGALLAMRRDAWEKVGPFDDGFKLYFEETDWLTRLKRKGLKAAFVPGAEAVHFYNQSAAREPAAAQWFEHSAVRFGRRYYGAWFGAFLEKISAGKARAAAPLLLSNGLPEVRLDFSHRKSKPPLWVEISPSPLFYPAAAHLVSDSNQASWRLPVEVWQYMTPGTYFLQIVDSAGVELGQFRFKRLPE